MSEDVDILWLEFQNTTSRRQQKTCFFLGFIKDPWCPKRLKTTRKLFACLRYFRWDISALPSTVFSFFFLLRSHLLVPGTVKLEEVSGTNCMPSLGFLGEWRVLRDGQRGLSFWSPAPMCALASSFPRRVVAEGASTALLGGPPQLLSVGITPLVNKYDSLQLWHQYLQWRPMNSKQGECFKYSPESSDRCGKIAVPLGQRSRYKKHRFSPGVGNIPWRRAWQPIPVFLPGESHGQRSLVGYSPGGHKESNVTEWLSIAHVGHNSRTQIWLTQRTSKWGKAVGAGLPRSPNSTCPRATCPAHVVINPLKLFIKNSHSLWYNRALIWLPRGFRRSGIEVQKSRCCKTHVLSDAVGS